MHFNCNINPQGWLPPCYLSVVVAGSAIHNYTPQTADSIEKHLPAPSPQDRAESDQNGHPVSAANWAVMSSSLVRLSAPEMEAFSTKLVMLQCFEFYEYTAGIIEKHLLPPTPQDRAKQIRTGTLIK
jgi:hypothetical protein